jgi:hypothetical protein
MTGRRPLHPELAEVRELLARGRRRVDGHRACREPVDEVAPDRAEVAGAEEDDHLVEVVAALDRVVEPQARVAEVLGHHAAELVATVVELARVERDGVDTLRVHHVHPHDAVVEEARVEELELEGEVRLPPDRELGAEADVPPLVVGDLAQPARHLAARVAVGLAGELLGALRHVVEGERGARAARRLRPGRAAG